MRDILLVCHGVLPEGQSLDTMLLPTEYSPPAAFESRPSFHPFSAVHGASRG